MKKFYSFMLCALLALVGYSAQAYTITVKADPAKVSRVQFGSYAAVNAGGGDVEFSAEGTLNVLSDEFFYAVKVTTKSGGEMYSTVVYSADGSESRTIHSSLNAPQMSYLTGADAFDGGVLEVRVGGSDNISFTVELEGDPSKVNFYVGEALRSLSVGSTTFTCAPHTYVYLQTTGGEPIYRVTLNGVDKNPTYNDGEVNYSFPSLIDGDVISIKTEYPTDAHHVTITSNEAAYVQSVTVNGEPVDDWADFSVNGGEQLRVVCDADHYKFNSFTVNGEERNFIGTFTTIVESDLDLVFDATPIVRDKQFTLKLGGILANPYVVMYGTNTSVSPVDNPATISYGDVDLPVRIFTDLNTTNQNSTDTRVAKVNGVEVARGFTALELTADMLHNGDVVELTTEKAYITVNATLAEGIVATLYGAETALNEGANKLSVKANPDENTIIFTAAEGYTLTSVKRNGVAAQAADAYSFTVADFDVYDVVAEVVAAPQPTTFTVKVDNPAAVITTYADEYLDLVAGENVFNLADFDLTWSEPTFYAGPMVKTTYYITSMKYNGEDIMGNTAYDRGGYFYIEDVKGGDVFEITTDMHVRDLTLHVYAAGIENAANPYVTDRHAEYPIWQNQGEGYYDATFGDFDNPLMIYQDLIFNGASVYAFLNNEPIEDVTEFVAHDGDMLKFYYLTEAPDLADVIYNVYGSEARPEVVADHFRVPDFQGGSDVEFAMDAESNANVHVHMELPGTHVAIKAPAGEVYNDVVVDGEVVEPDANGVYELTVSDPDFHKIEIYANDSHRGSSGIQAVDAATGTRTVYNLQGIRVNADQLPAGVYIINGKKVMVK